MQGNLNQVQLPEVLQFISMGKSTGLLTVREPRSGEITLAIESGRIINSSALERRRRLGELLVQRGILKRSQLSELLSLQRTIDSDKRLGQILVDREFVAESTIREVLRLQLEEEIWNLFGLDEGEFRFQHAQSEDLGEALVEIDIDPLLIEGSRRQDEWRKIAKIIPNDNVVPAVRDLSSDIYLEDKRKVGPHEWRVLAQVNGRFPLRAIVNRSGMGRFDVYRLLADLIERDIVYIKSLESESEIPIGNVPTIHDRATVVTPLSGVAKKPDAHQASSGGGMGGLFSRLTGGARRDEKTEKVSFVSPVGVLAYFINRMVEQFFQAKEFKGGENDSQLLKVMWLEELVQYTKADLILVDRNQLVADRLEEYLRLFEFGDAIQDCYEDSMEGLQSLMRALYKLFVSRMGERNAQRILRELMDDLRGNVSHRYAASNFRLEDSVQKLLSPG